MNSGTCSQMTTLCKCAIIVSDKFTQNSNVKFTLHSNPYGSITKPDIDKCCLFNK